MTADQRLARAEELLDRLETVRARLEATDDPEEAIEIVTELSELAKSVHAELELAKRESDAQS
jgi:hypothetical protein